MFDFGVAQSQETSRDLVERGQYIFSLAGGCACHSPPKRTPHAKSREFPIPIAKVYSTNLTNFLEEFWDKTNKRFVLKLEDEIIQGSLVTHAGEICNPKLKGKT